MRISMNSWSDEGLFGSVPYCTAKQTLYRALQPNGVEYARFLSYYYFLPSPQISEILEFDPQALI